MSIALKNCSDACVVIGVVRRPMYNSNVDMYEQSMDVVSMFFTVLPP